MTKINISQIYKIFNGSHPIKDFVKDGQLIMSGKTKCASLMLLDILFQIPNTLW